MAQRRMFSLQVVDTDAFLEMPLSAQALYFHLGMRADDDGFISNARRIVRLISASEDDMRILLAKRFLLSFDSGIFVIKHWKISNYIQKDRYRPTLYKEEKSRLYLKSDGAYTDHYVDGAKSCAAPVTPSLPDGDGMDTGCIHRLGEDRTGEVRLGEVSLGEVNKYLCDDGDTRAGAKALREYLLTRGLAPDQYFGTTDEIMAEVKDITYALFKAFASRMPTEADEMTVFQRVTQNGIKPGTNEWVMSIPKDRVDLLLYAFEQAALTGNPGNWNYINGVLANLSRRGIETLSDAENYDDENH